MASRRSNSIYMLIGQIAGKAGLLVSLMIYSRILEDGEFGALLLSVSFGLILVFLSDMGASMLITRRMSTGSSLEESFKPALILRSGLSLVSMVLVLWIALLAGYSRLQVLLIFLVSLGFILDGFCESAYAVFRAREMMLHEGAARTLHGLLAVVLAFLALATGRGPEFAGATYVIRSAPVVMYVFAVLMFRLDFRPFANRAVFKKALPLLKAAFPLGIAGLLIAAGQKLDGPFIKEFLGEPAIAAYQQCIKIFEALVLIVTPTLIPGALYPALCRAVKKDWGEARAYLAWMVETFLVLGFTVIICLWSFTGHILEILWGDGFLRGVPGPEVTAAFRVVLLTLPVAYLFHLYVATIIAVERQIQLVPVMTAALAAEIILFLFLIPLWGILGAAAAQMFFLGSATVWITLFIRKEYGISGLARGMRRPLGAFIIPAALLVTEPFTGWVNTAAAFTLFTGSWYFTGGRQMLPALRSGRC